MMMLHLDVLNLVTADLLAPWTSFAIVWSLGGSCDYAGRRVFDEWLRNKNKLTENPMPFPEEGLVYDYRFFFHNTLLFRAPL